MILIPAYASQTPAMAAFVFYKSEAKIDQLRVGEVSDYEPVIDVLQTNNIDAARFSVTTQDGEVVDGGEFDGISNPGLCPKERQLMMLYGQIV